MDAPEFVERVREENATRLDRLGSEKALVATTAASLDRETVFETAVAAETRASETFDRWLADEDDDDAREAFADARDHERTHRDRILEFAEADSADPEPDALHEHLRSLDSTVERAAAGLVARPLVASRSLLQVINFFVNEGEEGAADLFRELRADTDHQVERGAETVAAVCDDEAAWDRATEAAGAAIDVAYEEYATRLEDMGLDPKPVC